MNINRRDLLTLLGMGGLSAYAPLAWAQKTPSLTLWAAPVVPSVLMGVAAKQGKLRQKIPLDVKIWNTPDVLRAGIASGSMPVTLVPSYVAANLYNQGHDCILYNILTFGLLHVVSHGSPLARIQDLVGKTIAIPFKNDLPDLVLQILCQKSGIDIKKINIQYFSTPPEALGFFLKKKVDAVLLPEPMVSMAKLRGRMMGLNVHATLDMQKEWGRILKTKPRFPQAGLLVDRSYYKTHAQDIATLHNDLKDAWVWTEAHPSDAASIASSFLAAPKPALKMAIPNAMLSVTRAQDIQDELMFFYQQLYDLNPKIIGGKMPDKRLFSNT